MAVQYDFHASVGYWMTLATQTLHRSLNERLAPLGLTYRQMQLIGWLVHDRELTQAELARRMLVEPPTLVRILDRMQEVGWIARTECQQDHRRKLIRLTAEAEAVWEQITVVLQAVRTEAVKGLSTEEIDQLKRLLSKVSENLNSPELVREIS